MIAAKTITKKKKSKSSANPPPRHPYTRMAAGDDDDGGNCPSCYKGKLCEKEILVCNVCGFSIRKSKLEEKWQVPTRQERRNKLF